MTSRYLLCYDPSSDPTLSCLDTWSPCLLQQARGIFLENKPTASTLFHKSPKRFQLCLEYSYASVVHLVGASSCKPKVVGSIPGQGTYLGCGFDPWSRCIQEAANWCFFCSLPSSLSKKQWKECPWVRIKKKIKKPQLYLKKKGKSSYPGSLRSPLLLLS